MKKACRFLFRVAVIAWAIITLLIWIGSFWVSQSHSRTPPQRKENGINIVPSYSIRILNGMLIYKSNRFEVSDRVMMDLVLPKERDVREWKKIIRPGLWTDFRQSLLAFHYEKATYPPTPTNRIPYIDFIVLLQFPLWVLSVPSLPFVAFYLLKLRKYRRKNRWIREGRCLFCGYDLRATPQRCPECGKESPQPLSTP